MVDFFWITQANSKAFAVLLLPGMERVYFCGKSKFICFDLLNLATSKTKKIVFTTFLPNNIE